ncbi:hypothetical protein SCG7086_AB_00250 [Chlamydiales bacterium SCGC AG-110-P3]|nr:hypothetical protein SCG7086_AB_00250 [Chlamydiales bacterium SCGC AG-110-P3]
MNALDCLDEIITDKYPANLIEQQADYRHYTVMVDIPKLGRFIDDIDVWYNPDKRALDIRSASRLGFRDATNLDFSLQGANKKRCEVLRKAFQTS